MKDTSETIECFVPEHLSLEQYISTNNVTAIHHLARYMWALNTVPKIGKVLDVACGVGYGTFMIAQSNPNLTVLGIDYDQRAIDVANERYSLPNLIYKQGDLVKWIDSDNLPLGRFNCIVSFDTLEHLLHREIALINICENLNQDGCFLFSTPSGHKYPLLNPGWEHHKIEYSDKYLYNLMARFFKEVYYPDNNSLPNMSFWNDLNKNSNLYWNKMNPIFCQSPIKIGL